MSEFCIECGMVDGHHKPSCNSWQRDYVRGLNLRIEELEEQVTKLLLNAPPAPIVFTPDQGGIALANICETKQKRIEELEAERDEARKICRAVFHALCHDDDAAIKDLQDAVNRWDNQDDTWKIMDDTSEGSPEKLGDGE